jgi:hypothetical protein
MKAIVEDHDFVRGLGRDATVVELDKEELFVLLRVVAKAVVEGRGGEEICAIVFIGIAIYKTTLTAQVSVLNGLEVPTVTIPAMSLFERPFVDLCIGAKVKSVQRQITIDRSVL